MDTYHRKSRFLFATNAAFAVAFVTIFLSGLFATPANAATDGWHIKDDTTGGDCYLIGNWSAGSKTCVLTSDLHETTQIDSDLITLDGNGHVIAVPGGSIGIYVTERRGVTIKNLNIQQPTSNGIVLYKSYNSIVANNTIAFVPVGIYVGDGENNIVDNNTISYSTFGIALEHSANNIIQNNSVESGTYGISFFYVGHSFGFLVDPYVGSPNNKILNNTIQNNLSDIEMGGFTDPALCNNIISGNIGSGGLPIGYFNSQTTLTGGVYAELIFCNADDSNISNVTTTSSFNNNRLVILLTDNSKFTNIAASYNHYAGAGIQLNYSHFNIFKNIVVSNNTYGGIAFGASSHNEIDGAMLDANGEGLLFFNNSSQNIIHYSTISNSGTAIDKHDRGDNQIYNNNFINNLFLYKLWDDSMESFNLAKPVGGNYWSDYSTPAQGCTDTNSDGFCDAPYIFTGGQDNLPWTKRDGWLAPSNQPPTLSGLGQFDGATSITEGEILRHPYISSFSAIVSDPDGDQVKLQVELRRFEELFTGIDDGGMLTSDLVPSENVARVPEWQLSCNCRMAIQLADGKYHWRARAIDSKDNKSEWQEFGVAGNVDFEIRTKIPIDTFVALGDSFSSGFGVPPFEEGTHQDRGFNDCQRSENAYPQIVAGVVELGLSFHACQGATTKHMYEGRVDGGNDWGEAPQLENLDQKTELVTLTIGGNDIGFADVLKECILGFELLPFNTCFSDAKVTDPVQEALTRLDGGSGSSDIKPYDVIYKDIRKLAPIAKGIAIGYPHLFTATGDDRTFLPGGRCEGVKKADQRWMVEKIDELNDIIERNALRNSLLFALPVFDGHELCGAGEEWIFDALSDGAFHPTINGHRAIAKAVTDELRDDAQKTKVFIEPLQTLAYAFSVESGKALLSFTSEWPGSDIVTSLQSPSGVIYTRNSGNAFHHDNGATWEHYEITQPETGAWTAALYGADVAPQGEDAVLSVYLEDPPNQSPVGNISWRIEGSTLMLDGGGSHDPDGQITSYNWYITTPQGEEVYTGPVVRHLLAQKVPATITLVVTDDRGGTDFVSVTLVPIDVLPGSDVNPINPKVKGVLPVAILSSAMFDASTIDPDSLHLGPGQATPAKNSVHREDVNNDGVIDLMLQFPIQQLGIESRTSRLCMTGELPDGTMFESCDEVKVK